MYKLWTNDNLFSECDEIEHKFAPLSQCNRTDELSVLHVA
jgi:hypothetical protein